MPGPVSDPYPTPSDEPQTLHCAFCGQAYPPGTPPSQHQRLTEHINQCPKHPVRLDLIGVLRAMRAFITMSKAQNPPGNQLPDDIVKLDTSIQRLEEKYGCRPMSCLPLDSGTTPSETSP